MMFIKKMKGSFILLLCFLQNAYGQHAISKNVSFVSPGSYYYEDSIAVRITKLEGNLYFLDCINGFGGGNVAASIGPNGIFLVDDMYASMSDKLKAALRTISDKPIYEVVNTHFHRDHIEGNKILSGPGCIILAQENVKKQLIKRNTEAKPTLGMLPSVTFSDSVTLFVNNEEVKVIHYPNCHTDGDAVVYFTQSHVLHMGDMFFFGMFPAVYADGGGDIKQLINALDIIVKRFPENTHVIPGHGSIATMKDLADYRNMLKETVQIVETNISQGKTLAQMTAGKVLAKYDVLGTGGAQTTDQYLAMLYKLLIGDKK